jgi:hypothetical protein
MPLRLPETYRPTEAELLLGDLWHKFAAVNELLRVIAGKGVTLAIHVGTNLDARGAPPEIYFDATTRDKVLAVWYEDDGGRSNHAVAAKAIDKPGQVA